MDQATYQEWWQLHLRVARGESLSSDEQTRYEKGLNEIEDGEHPVAVDTKQLRDQLHALEQEHARLESQRQELNAEIGELETRLSSHGVRF